MAPSTRDIVISSIVIESTDGLYGAVSMNGKVSDERRTAITYMKKFLEINPKKKLVYASTEPFYYGRLRNLKEYYDGIVPIEELNQYMDREHSEASRSRHLDEGYLLVPLSHMKLEPRYLQAMQQVFGRIDEEYLIRELSKVKRFDIDESTMKSVVGKFGHFPSKLLSEALDNGHYFERNSRKPIKSDPVANLQDLVRTDSPLGIFPDWISELDLSLHHSF